VNVDDLAQARASHAGDRYDERVAACTSAMGVRALHHIAHYTNASFDFRLDRLAGVVPLGELEETRRRLVLAGRGLADLHRSMGDETRGAMQGALIRIVLQTDAGALFSNLIVPGEVVVGLHLAEEPVDPEALLTRRPGVEAADRAMAEAATGIRAQLSLSAQNPGGFVGLPESTGDVVLPDGDLPTGEAAEEDADGDGPWARALQAAVRAEDLHYAVRVQSGIAELVEGTMLDSPPLARFHAQVEPSARRAFYRQLAESLPETAQAVNSVSSRVLGVPLRRLVLDVEQGALYVYPLSARVLLLGATLNQSRVAAADERMARLARDATALPRDVVGAGSGHTDLRSTGHRESGQVSS
jgi:hypothetical protein